MLKKIFIIYTILLTIFSKNILAIEISSPSAVVICSDSGRVLFEKNSTEKRKMASLTKIMTALLLVENCKMDENITIDKRATQIGGSKAGIKANDIITAENLLYGMLLPSGNDCALAIAYHIGGSIENFAQMMNNKANELGLDDTHFANPHGLDNDEHYTTALSLALLTKYALSYSKIKEVVSTNEKDVVLGSFTKHLTNTNSLLRTYEKANGVKTGFTNGANRCLIASAKENELELIAVVLGSETSSIRFKDAKDILEDTFNKYKLYDISNFLNVYINIPIVKGNIKNYISSFSDNKKEALTDEEYKNIYVSQNFVDKLEAPIKAGTYIGTYKVSIGDEILYSKDFFTEYDIAKNSAKDYFILFIKNMFNKLEKI